MSSSVFSGRSIINSDKQQQVKSLGNFWVVICLFMAFFDTTLEQNSRLAQFFPLPVTVNPPKYTNPVYNGIYLNDKKVYIHAEYAATNGNIGAFGSDGTIKHTLTSNSPNAKSLVRSGDYLVSFGELTDIRLYFLKYFAPDYYIQVSVNYTTHNLNLNKAILVPSTSNFLVTTTTSGKVYCFQQSNLNIAQTTGTYASQATASLESIVLLSSSQVAVAGSSTTITISDVTTLTMIAEYPIAAKTDFMVKDTLDAWGRTIIDTAENTGFNLVRIEVTASAATQFLTKTFTAVITNIVEFNNVNYLVVTSGSLMELLKRTTYSNVGNFSLQNSLLAGSVACCDESSFRYTFSAILNTPALEMVFSSFKINIDFCSSYSGTTCTECYQGFKLNNLDPGNKCISIDEYPPKYGSKINTISPCADSKCERCLLNYLKCELCPAGLLLNMATFECNDLNSIQFYGKDPTNSSIIRRCNDPECLFCKDDYNICTACQVEYFRLENNECKRKNTDLVVVKTWFDRESYTANILLNSPIVTDLPSLFPKNITVLIKDQYDDNFTDFSEMKVSLSSDKKQIIVWVGFLRSIYNGNLTLSQNAVRSIVYNDYSYFSVNQEFIVDDIRVIQTPLYFKLLDSESTIQIIVWIIMIIGVLAGTGKRPWLGSLTMRYVSVCTVYAHLNGPNLHSSDLWFDIISKVGFPLIPITTMQKDIAPGDCRPGNNFMKRDGGYSSCDLISMYGRSLLIFTIYSILPILLSWFVYNKKKEFISQIKMNKEFQPEDGLATWLVRDRYFGVRNLLVILDASAPIVIQYTLLNILTLKSFTVGVPFSLIAIAIYGLHLYCLFRFLFTFLDFQYLSYLKLTNAEKENRKESNLNNSRNVTNNPLNTVVPKKGSLIVNKDTAKPSENETNQLDAPSNFEFTAEELNQFKPDPRNARYPLMNYSLANFTMIARYPRPFFYYLPLLELMNVCLAQFIVVRFSDSGMIQVYIICAFEFLLFCLTVSMRPFATKFDFASVIVFKLFSFVILALRLANFATMSEESSRQKGIDGFLAIIGIAFLAYCAICSLFAAALGIKDIIGMQQDIKEEEEYLKKIKFENDIENESGALPINPEQSLDQSHLPLSQYTNTRKDSPQREPRNLVKANAISSSPSNKVISVNTKNKVAPPQNKVINTGETSMMKPSVLSDKTEPNLLPETTPNKIRQSKPLPISKRPVANSPTRKVDRLAEQIDTNETSKGNGSQIFSYKSRHQNLKNVRKENN